MVKWVTAPKMMCAFQVLDFYGQGLVKYNFGHFNHTSIGSIVARWSKFFGLKTIPSEVCPLKG